LRSKRNPQEFWGKFFPICIALGTGVGALLGNVGVGISLGAGVGTTLSLIFYYLRMGK
jgi:hypothetical protein